MLQALILLINSLLMSDPTMDPATLDAAIQEAGYTATYDYTTGDATVSNPDGSIIVIDPSEQN